MNFVKGVHHQNGKYYYKIREGREYFDKEAPTEKVYTLDRYYRFNKTILKLKMMFVRIKLLNSDSLHPYSCGVYSLDDVDPADVVEIKCAPHVNTKRGGGLSQPHYRTSKSVLQRMDALLDEGKPYDVFDNLLMESGGPMLSSSISGESQNYRQVLNRQNMKRRKASQNNPTPKDDVEKLLSAQRDPNSLIGSVVVYGDSYLVFLYNKQLEDIEQFCCSDNDVSVWYRYHF